MGGKLEVHHLIHTTTCDGFSLVKEYLCVAQMPLYRRRGGCKGVGARLPWIQEQVLSLHVSETGSTSPVSPGACQKVVMVVSVLCEGAKSHLNILRRAVGSLGASYAQAEHVQLSAAALQIRPCCAKATGDVTEEQMPVPQAKQRSDSIGASETEEKEERE